VILRRLGLVGRRRHHFELYDDKSMFVLVIASIGGVVDGIRMGDSTLLLPCELKLCSNRLSSLMVHIYIVEISLYLFIFFNPKFSHSNLSSVSIVKHSNQTIYMVQYFKVWF